MRPLTIIFDLDDTLYLERDYVRSGFAAVGDWLEQETGVGGFSASCQRLFDAGRRSRIFQKALVLHSIDPDPTLVELLIGVYRSHSPAINLAPDAARYLETRRRTSLPSGLITDGPCGTQQRKVHALGIAEQLDLLVYTDALAPGCGKPHPRAFEVTEAWAAPTGLPLAYVADNPTKDFLTPRQRGWLSVQVARPERVHLARAPNAAYEAQATISSLDELEPCLQRLQSQQQPAEARRDAARSDAFA
ncbi:HAD family hydrolase [Arvimicrobium flavum]|uniref:HAD family hydrolase n=1 Tax=Arvimicrobium flavum TaxID=3393320 RepID=UPI00237BC277|nr:HAD family hydrolase [Mesorhizobium shangrilense]